VDWNIHLYLNIYMLWYNILLNDRKAYKD